MLIVEIQVALENIEPAVKRTLLVPLSLRLDRLHLVLQAAMGWENSHLYMFQVGAERWGLADPEFDMGEQPAIKAKLSDLIAEASGNPIVYIYDFGDDWMHTLTIGDMREPNAGELYPKLTNVEGKCPPEDIGGFPGYEHFLDAMADKKHPEHDNMMDWYGGSFDPNAPETDELKFEVARLAKRWKPQKPKA